MKAVRGRTAVVLFCLAGASAATAQRGIAPEMNELAGDFVTYLAVRRCVQGTLNGDGMRWVDTEMERRLRAAAADPERWGFLQGARWAVDRAFDGHHPKTREALCDGVIESFANMLLRWRASR